MPQSHLIANETQHRRTRGTSLLNFSPALLCRRIIRPVCYIHTQQLHNYVLPQWGPLKTSKHGNKKQHHKTWKQFNSDSGIIVNCPTGGSRESLTSSWWSLLRCPHSPSRSEGQGEKKGGSQWYRGSLVLLVNTKQKVLNAFAIMSMEALLWSSL